MDPPPQHQQDSHNNKKIDFHVPWEFRREAFIWIGDMPLRANFLPVGGQLQKWLQQQGRIGALHAKDEKQFSNPYTHSASSLALSYSYIVNDSFRFSRSKAPMSAARAEIQYLRLYTESVLYTARICEALLKQLLFCTTISEKEYRRATLASLLSKECSAAYNSKEHRHKLSLLGSLAHRYNLCHYYKHCLKEHITIINERRNLEAAHSGSIEFAPSTAAAARKCLEDKMLEIGEAFTHMLQHISEIEDKMLSELNSNIT